MNEYQFYKLSLKQLVYMDFAILHISRLINSSVYACVGVCVCIYFLYCSEEWDHLICSCFTDVIQSTATQNRIF